MVVAEKVVLWLQSLPPAEAQKLLEGEVRDMKFDDEYFTPSDDREVIAQQKLGR